MLVFHVIFILWIYIMQTDGTYKIVDQVLDDVSIIRKTQSNLLPWYCSLELLDVKIPIKSYVKVIYTIIIIIIV